MVQSLVSIITPAYNCSEFIKGTIDSVQQQTYDHWEMIIVDDCSSDKTYKLANQAAGSDARIKVIRNSKNEGPAISRNRATEEAKGSYIAFLDGDDCWNSEKLETQLSFMKEKGALFSHTSYMLINEDGEELGKKSTAPQSIGYRNLIKFNWIGTSTVMYNSEKLGKHFMADLHNRQDWACWIQLSKKAVIHFIDTPLTKYRVQKNSISKNKFKMIKYHWAVYKNVEGFNTFKSIVFLLLNLVNHARIKKIVSYSVE